MIYDKLQQARVLLQGKNLKKSGKNQYYDYYELADFIPAINEIFDSLKLHSQFNITREKAILLIINTEKPEETELFECPIVKAELKGCTAVQAMGATITYMKRYLYMNALEIVESDYMDAKTVNDMKKKDADIDIFAQLQAIDTAANAYTYYTEHEPLVNDKIAFKKAYTARYLELKKKETKKELESASNN